ncbi:MAG: universal stress protein [Gammaproteobacteria bacterium]|nr:universal stress protein [Gammaproteobacteria bacterium]
MYAKILVPVDGSATSARGLAEAVRLAGELRSKLRLVHIVNELVIAPAYPTGMQSGQVLESMRAHGRAVVQDSEKQVHAAGLEVDSVMIESVGGAAGDIIVEQAGKWGAELIVLGTHGRRGLKRMVLGSDAEHVVRHSSVPVLLVRAP